MDNRINTVSIDKTSSIISALKKMDSIHVKLLIVLDNDHFYSLLSIGDIQRAIISNTSLDSEISKILRPTVKVARVSDSKEIIKATMKERRNDFMPIVDDNNSRMGMI